MKYDRIKLNKRGKTNKLNIEDMYYIANLRGGKCLSDTYINVTSKLKWQCNKNHIWETTPGTILNGGWCPFCAGKIKYTIEYMHELANKHGGKCLSDVYINKISKLKWMCKNNHIWEAVPNSIIKMKTWCKECYLDDCRYTFDELNKIAQDKNGKCLSNEYIGKSIKNTNIKIKFVCEKGHIWNATVYSIVRGTWCPDCNKSYKEQIVRSIFEEYFNEKFPHIRPQWLKGNKGYTLELDGYCEKLGIAFEYNGAQHYKVISVFNMNKKLLKEQKARDKIKIKTCEEKGIKLIIIKEPKNRSNKKLKNIVLNKIKKIKI